MWSLRLCSGEGLTLHNVAADIAPVIRQLTGDKVSVLGYAFGNGVARMLALDHASTVQIIILAAAQCSPVPSEISKTSHQARNLVALVEERLGALRKGSLHRIMILASGYSAGECHRIRLVRNEPAWPAKLNQFAVTLQPKAKVRGDGDSGAAKPTRCGQPSGFFGIIRAPSIGAVFHHRSILVFPFKG